MYPFYIKWLKISIFNLGIVAALGVTLRFKIAFSLPFIDQGNLLHGHSHFAFSGWVTQALFILLIYNLKSLSGQNLINRYSWVLWSNLLISYGMLVSFAIQGYAFFSIFFSVLSIIISFIFSFYYWKDLNKTNSNSNHTLWFKAALFFNIISCLGPFSLAYMRANHILLEKMYMLAIYYFLHFQYNGWFLFACIGLFISVLSRAGSSKKSYDFVFWTFSLSCIPTFFLSALWLKLPPPIYWLVIISAFMQIIAWIWYVRIAIKDISTIPGKMQSATKWLIFIATIAMTIKLTLQLGSTYPPLSQVAFGFRPIVIGYIHLVLLGVITMSIFAFILFQKIFAISRGLTWGIIIFVSGIFLNELFLMLQGLLAMATISINNINIYLFIAALVMFTGIGLINLNLSPAERNELLNK